MKRENLRLLSLLLCFVFCLNFCLPVGLVQAEPLPQEEEREDWHGHWAEKAISKWRQKSLVGGYPDGSFRPDQSLTRAEFVALVNRVFNYTQKAPLQFTDLSPEEWYIDDIAKAVAAGYINGYPDGTFRPEQTITRQEVAAILSQLLSLAGTTEDVKKFKDEAEIPFWSLGSIGAIVANGYMGGYADESFRPAQPLTRAEAISALDRALGVLYNQKGTYGPLLTTTTVEGNVTLTTQEITLKNMIITGDLYLSAGIEAGQLSLDNVQVLGTVKIKGGTELYLSPETQLKAVVIDTPVAITGEGVIQKAYINSSDVTLATKPEKIEIAEEVTDFNIEEDEPEPSEVEEEANINFASGYPQVGNIQTDRLDLIVKTNKDGKAYYLILPVSKDAPSPEQIITGRDASDKSVDSRHYGRIRLTADERTREQIRGLRPTTSYQLYLVLEDAKGNFTEVTTIKATTKRKTSARPVTIERIDNLIVTVEVGEAYILPATVTAHMSDGTTQEVPVTWEPATVDTGEEGDYTFTGTVAGYAGEVTLTLRVVEEEVEKYQVILEANPEEGGTVSGGGEYPVDATVFIEAEANPGFTFLNWMEGDTVLTTEAVYSFAMRAKDVFLTANFEKELSQEATLKDLTIDGETISGFSPEITAYTIELTEGEDIPVVDAEATDPEATVTISQATKIPGEAVIVVTAEDGSSLTYTVMFKLRVEPDPETCIVTFDENGGDTEAEPKTMEVEHGGMLEVLPTPPTKAGHSFIGWNTQADGTGDEFTGDTPVTGDITVYAQWEEIKVTEVSLNKSAITLKVGDTETLVATVEPEDAYNKAVTWSSSNEAVATVDGDGLVTAVAEGEATITVKTDDGGKTDACEVTVVKSTPEIHTVTFKDDETILGTQTVEHGKNATAPEAPTREGYTFAGWYKDEACTEEWAFDENIVTEDLTLYAKWEAIEYTITYHLAGGTNHAANPETYTIETATITLVPASKVGYTFVGWYDAEEGGNKITEIAQGSIGDITLYARWEPSTDTPYKVEHYQQNIDDDGYTLVETEELTGTTGATVTAEAKDYTGFTENTAHEDRVASGTIAADGSLVLKLYYDRETFTVTFDSKGGSEVSAITGVRYEAKITAPSAPTREGYTFAGWYKDEACTEEWDFEVDIVTEDITLYAQWEEIKVTGVSLNIAAITLKVGDTETLVATVEPEDAYNKAVTWSSSNEAVATVDGDGLVTAVAEGEAIITVETADGGYKDTCTVTVVIPVENVTVTGAEGATTVEKGKTLQMIVNIEPGNATDRTVSWSVENGTGEATIDENGVLTGVAKGTVTVIATANDGFGTVGSLEITVVEPVGVSWTVGTDTKMTRLGAAQDFKAEKFEDIGIFFNQLYPWSEMKLCNVADDGTITAYIGEPGFTRDGTNGQVMVKIPKFYYKHTYDGNEHQFWIADQPVAGFSLHPCFDRAGGEKDYVLIGAYEAGEITDEGKTKLTSVSGLLPAVSRTRATFRSQAQNRGESWYIVDALARNAVSLLYLVEYADTDCQEAIGQGITGLAMSESHQILGVVDDDQSRIIVSVGVANSYKKGEAVAIGFGLWYENRGRGRIITDISSGPEEGQCIITVDKPFNGATAGDILKHCAQYSGGCDDLAGASGRAAGTNGRVSVSYRGIEDLWGNVWEFIDGINIKNGNSEIREPYIADVTEPDFLTKADTFDEPYQATGITLPETDGYCGNFAASEDADWLLMPNTLGGSTSTYIPDYFYQNWANTADKVALAGGRWGNGNSAGLFYWDVNHSSSDTPVSFGARLLQIP